MAKKKFTEELKPVEMTNKQIRGLREAGLHIYSMEEKELARKMDEFTFWILDNVYPEIDFSETSHKVCAKFAVATLTATYGGDDEAKNS